MKSLITAVVVLVVSMSIPSAHAVITAPQGYWKFDDGSNTSPPYASRGIDSSGNSRNLDIFSYAGAPWPTGANGSGGAIVYDGNGAHRAMRPGDDAIFDVGGGNFTAQVWYKPDSVAGEQVLLEKFSNPTGPGWTFYKNSSGFLEFFADGDGTDPNIGITASSGALTVNDWQQLVLTRNGSTFTFYRNGISVGGGTSASVISDSSSPLLSGARYPSFAVPMSGLVDEVAFWNVGMNDAQVLELFNSVPEPTTATLLAVGGVLVGMRRRRGV